MTRTPRWAVPVIGALVAAVLSSGLTAVYLHGRFPEIFPLATPPVVAPEQVHLAELLVEPGPPFRPVSSGTPFQSGQAAQRFAALGLTRGWTRTWDAPDARLDAYLLEFADARGAAGYAGGIGRVAGAFLKPAAFRVPGVPGASGLADTVADRGGRYAQAVAFARANRAVLLTLSTTDATPGGLLVEIAQREYAALAT
jgi:hypothetical protein